MRLVAVSDTHLFETELDPVPEGDVFASVVALAIVLTLLLQALPARWLAGRLGLLEPRTRPVAVDREAA